MQFDNQEHYSALTMYISNQQYSCCTTENPLKAAYRIKQALLSKYSFITSCVLPQGYQQLTQGAATAKRRALPTDRYTFWNVAERTG